MKRKKKIVVKGTKWMNIKKTKYYDLDAASKTPIVHRKTKWITDRPLFMICNNIVRWCEIHMPVDKKMAGKTIMCRLEYYEIGEKKWN